MPQSTKSQQKKAQFQTEKTILPPKKVLQYHPVLPIPATPFQGPIA